MWMEKNSMTVAKKIQKMGARCTEVLLVQRAKGDASSRVSLEVVGEIVLLTAIAVFFVYMFVESMSWGKGAALMPRITILLGLPFWLLRIIAIARRSESKSSANIMDTGFSACSWAGRRRRCLLKTCSMTILVSM